MANGGNEHDYDPFDSLDSEEDAFGQGGPREDYEFAHESPPQQQSSPDEPGYCVVQEPTAESMEPVADAAPAAHSAEDEQLLCEIEKSQNKSRGVIALVLTLLISGAVFVVVGKAWWSWELVLMFLAILLIHEFGHFVTMKGLKYRNVNMFFIPLLGAAVTGRHYNTPAWKKAMVALMGPLPSIFLATGVGIAAVVADMDWLVYACVLSLFLNGLNLAPFLPFDGGHVLHAVLFCRHYYLDVAFRVITVLIVLAFAVLLEGSPFLVGLAVFLGMTILITLRNGRIARELKSEGSLELAGEDDRVTPATALRVAHALRAGTNPKMSAKALAQSVLQVVEQINAHPPGVLASIGLLFLHGAGLGVALFAGFFLSIAVNEDLRERFWVAAEPPPLYAYDCDAVETRGERYVPTFGTNYIIATFATPADANTAYKSAKPDISAQDHLQRFGRTVSIALSSESTPEMRKSWIDRWELEAQELIVDLPYSPVLFSLDATFSDAAFARRVDNEVQAYLKNEFQSALSPPWQPDAPVRDPAEGERYEARRTCIELSKAVDKAIDDDKRAASAVRIADYDKLQEIRDEITRSTVADLKTSNPDIDVVTADLYVRWTTGEYDKEAYRLLLERMGGVFIDYEEYEDPHEGDSDDDNDSGSAKTADDSPGDSDIDADNADGEAPEADEFDEEDYDYALTAGYERYGARGSSFRNRKTVSFRAVSLNVDAEGARAITDWLCSLGAQEITYAFYVDDWE